MGKKCFESFKDCPTGQSNAISKQSAEISQKNSELEKLKAQYTQLHAQALTNSMLVKMNSAQSKAVSQDIVSEKDEKMNELKKLDKGGSGGRTVPFNANGLSGFAKALAKAPTIA